MKRFLHLTAILSLLLFVGLTACSKKEAGPAELTISGDDNMQFDKSELRVKEGQQVKLTLIHTGTMDKAAMGHNFVLLDKGTDFNEFATAAMTDGNDNHLPNDESGIIAHTDVIGGGESTTITFDAPAKGSYDFLCSFPGHSAMMKGKFIVE